MRLCFRHVSGFVIPYVKTLGERGGSGGGGIYWNRRVLVSVSSCVCLLDYVQNISSEQLNLVYPKVVWWSTVLSRCVMRKNWDATFKVKVRVTGSAYIIKMTVSVRSSELMFDFLKLTL